MSRLRAKWLDKIRSNVLVSIIYSVLGYPQNRVRESDRLFAQRKQTL